MGIRAVVSVVFIGLWEEEGGEDMRCNYSALIGLIRC